MRRVLLTGGSGFVGHHVIDYAMRETDWEIVALDGLKDAGDVQKVVELESWDPTRCTVVWHDLRSHIWPETAAKIGVVDAILNLASGSEVERSIADPVPFITNNVAVAMTILEYARLAKPRMVVQFSTDEVYGPAGPNEYHAEWSAIVPSNPYAASKAAQEAIAVAYWRTYQVPVVITNTMNVIGEHQSREKLVGTAVSKIEAGKPMPVYAHQEPDGSWVSGSRCWIYAWDVASALRFIVERTRPAKFPNADRPDRYNIVGEEMANDDLVKMIAEEMGKPVELDYIDFHSSRPGHDRRYALDGGKLAALGWMPTMGVREGIRRTLEAI